MGLSEVSSRPQIRSPQDGVVRRDCPLPATEEAHLSGPIPASILLSRASDLLSCGDLVSTPFQHDRISRFNSYPTGKSSGSIPHSSDVAKAFVHSAIKLCQREWHAEEDGVVPLVVAPRGNR